MDLIIDRYEGEKLAYLQIRAAIWFASYVFGVQREIVDVYYSYEAQPLRHPQEPDNVGADGLGIAVKIIDGAIVSGDLDPEATRQKMVYEGSLEAFRAAKDQGFKLPLTPPAVFINMSDDGRNPVSRFYNFNRLVKSEN